MKSTITIVVVTSLWLGGAAPVFAQAKKTFDPLDLLSYTQRDDRVNVATDRNAGKKAQREGAPDRKALDLERLRQGQEANQAAGAYTEREVSKARAELERLRQERPDEKAKRISETHEDNLRDVPRIIRDIPRGVGGKLKAGSRLFKDEMELFQSYYDTVGAVADYPENSAREAALEELIRNLEFDAKFYDDTVTGIENQERAAMSFKWPDWTKDYLKQVIDAQQREERRKDVPPVSDRGIRPNSPISSRPTTGHIPTGVSHPPSQERDSPRPYTGGQWSTCPGPGACTSQ